MTSDEGKWKSLVETVSFPFAQLPSEHTYIYLRLDSMFNTSGCPYLLGRDDFFLKLDSKNNCIVVIPFYFIYVVLSAIILAFVAYARTVYILKRFKARGRFSTTQKILIVQSWCSCISANLLWLIPLTYGTQDNVMTLLLGIHYLLFNISSERWVTKLLKLGNRIMRGIGGGKVISSSDDQDNQDIHLQLDAIMLPLLLSTRVSYTAVFSDHSPNGFQVGDLSIENVV